MDQRRKMKLELDDFSLLTTIQQEQKGGSQKKEHNKESQEEKIAQLEQFYQNKILELEQHYKELLNKVAKESYDQGFQDASAKYEQQLQEQLQKLQEEFQSKIDQEKEHFVQNLATFEEKLLQKYNHYIMKFSDIVLDAMEEILAFLFVDPHNTKYVQEAIKRLLEDFHNYMPLTIHASGELYEMIKDRFEHIRVKKSSELKDNEFSIEFHDFKIENKIFEKMAVIKDEIKREIKKLT